jgi:hypothetical protein
MPAFREKTNGLLFAVSAPCSIAFECMYAWKNKLPAASERERKYFARQFPF